MDQLLKVTFRPFNTPATMRVLESIERFQLNGDDIKLVSTARSENDDHDIIVIEGHKKTLIQLAKYIEALEIIVRDWDEFILQ